MAYSKAAYISETLPLPFLSIAFTDNTFASGFSSLIYSNILVPCPLSSPAPSTNDISPTRSFDAIPVSITAIVPSSNVPISFSSHMLLKMFKESDSSVTSGCSSVAFSSVVSSVFSSATISSVTFSVFFSVTCSDSVTSVIPPATSSSVTFSVFSSATISSVTFSVFFSVTCSDSVTSVIPPATSSVTSSVTSSLSPLFSSFDTDINPFTSTYSAFSQ